MSQSVFVLTYDDCFHLWELRYLTPFEAEIVIIKNGRSFLESQRAKRDEKIKYVYDIRSLYIVTKQKQKKCIFKDLTTSFVCKGKLVVG